MDALGLALDEVFVIVNEPRRHACKILLTKYSSPATWLGLANHTLPGNKVGRDIPIDDSAAPIRNEQGDLAGVVLIFVTLRSGVGN